MKRILHNLCFFIETKSIKQLYSSFVETIKPVSWQCVTHYTVHEGIIRLELASDVEKNLVFIVKLSFQYWRISTTVKELIYLRLDDFDVSKNKYKIEEISNVKI